MQAHEQILLKRCVELTEVQGAYKAFKLINDNKGFHTILTEEKVLAMAYAVCGQLFNETDIKTAQYMKNINEPIPEMPKETTRLESID